MELADLPKRATVPVHCIAVVALDEQTLVLMANVADGALTAVSATRVGSALDVCAQRQAGALAGDTGQLWFGAARRAVRNRSVDTDPFRVAHVERAKILIIAYSLVVATVAGLGIVQGKDGRSRINVGAFAFHARRATCFLQPFAILIGLAAPRRKVTPFRRRTAARQKMVTAPRVAPVTCAVISVVAQRIDTKWHATHVAGLNARVVHAHRV